MLTILESKGFANIIGYRFHTDNSLVKSVVYVISSNFQRLRYDKGVTKTFGATF